jgi:hypothetical protein
MNAHLKILREAGLIQTRSADGRPCYCLKDEGIRALVAGVQGL